MTILQDSKIARASTRPSGAAHGCAAMTMQDSKIARASARPKGDMPGGMS